MHASGASPKPPGAPRPHRTRTEAAPCVARTAASAEQRLKGRATRLGALCHCSRLAIFAGLLKPCRPDCPASSAAPATGRSGARLGACPGRESPTVGCATRACAPRPIGACATQTARAGARVGTVGTDRRTAAPQDIALPCRPLFAQQARCAKRRPARRSTRVSCSALAPGCSWPVSAFARAPYAAGQRTAQYLVRTVCAGKHGNCSVGAAHASRNWRGWHGAAAHSAPSEGARLEQVCSCPTWHMHDALDQAPVCARAVRWGTQGIVGSALPGGERGIREASPPARTSRAKTPSR